MRQLVLLLLAAFLVACDSDPGTATATSEVTAKAEATPSSTPRVTFLNTPTPTPAWTRTPEPSPVAEPVGHPVGTETGLDTVDAVIEAFVSGDEQALNDLIDWQTEPCVRPPVNDYGPPPICQDGQETGDPTQFIPVSACHGGYRTPAEEEFTFQFARNGGRLYGVRGPLALEAGDRAYVVVLTTTSGQTAYGHSFVVGDVGVVSQELGCGFSPEFMWERSAPHPVVLAPAEDDLYGYSPETRVDGGGVVDQVAVAVALRLPAELRAHLAPQEKRCLPTIQISYQETGECSDATTDDPEEPAFVVGGCHYGIRTPEEFEASLYGLLDHRPRLYGVRHIAGWVDERAGLALFFTRPSQEFGPGFAILVSDEGIVGLDGSCGEETPDFWAKYDRFVVGSPMLPPWEAP